MTIALGEISPQSRHVEGSAAIGPLPFPMSPLVGRDTQIAVIAERLRLPDVRILTLVGPGGIGKSRLATEAASMVRGDFEDGVHLLRFATVSDPSLVALTIARALDVQDVSGGQPTWSVARNRHCLLVIDNFEQLLPAAAVLAEVLGQCPHIDMLITSRVALNISGEHEFQVPALSLPPEDASDIETIGQADAVRLFVERASAADPDFRLTSQNAAAVAEITRRLDGLPLAIELAAARCKHLSPRFIVERLETTSDVLRGGPVDRPPHQRAMRDTISWSHSLLDPGEQDVFRKLSIFSGGFTAQAAEFVCGASDSFPEVHLPDAAREGTQHVLERCISLFDKSLIFKADDIHLEPRFSMLLTIRAFAYDDLALQGSLDEVADRHAAWYMAFANAAARAIRGPFQRTWLDWLEAEHGNLRDALVHFRKREDYASYAAMAYSLSVFWLVRGHFLEGLRWIRPALVAGRAGSVGVQVRVGLLAAAGWLALRQGLPEEGRAYAEESLDLARQSGDPGPIAAALRLLGDIEDRFANYSRATELMSESLEFYRVVGDAIGIADTLTGLAGIAMDTGDYGEAVRIFRDAVTAARVTGDAIILARAIDSLSLATHVSGEPEAAIALAEEALDLYRTHGNARGIAIAMDHVGKYSRATGNLDRAWACHRESLAWRRKVGDPRGMAVWLEAMAGLLASCDRLETAACVLGAVERIRQRGGFPAHRQEKAQLQTTVLRIEQVLGPRLATDSRDRGSMMTLPDVVDLAFAEAERAMEQGGRGVGAVATQPIEVQATAKGLTQREREVAGFLATGLSNKEIGERLAISPRTVSTHVTVILGKLGVRSRRDIGQFARLLELDTNDRE